MGDRVKGKIAIVIGAGQTLGDTIGNGRAIALLFAREGARVMLVDRRLDSAQEKDEITNRRNQAVPLKGGMGTAWDIAYTTLFLASDEAKFITSVIIPVDGGMMGRVGQ